MADLKDFNQEQEKESIYREWDSIDLQALDLQGARSGEQRLSEALDRAIDEGADKEVMGQILDEWKGYHDRATEILKELNVDGRSDGRPDAMKDFAEQSRDNADKGMHVLGGKVDDLTDQKKKGFIKSAPEFTGKILAAHEKVVEVFHEKQQQLSKALHKGLENIKLNLQNISDMAKVNRWIKAVDAAERYDAQHESKLDSIKDKQAAKTEKIVNDRDAGHVANREAYDKIVSAVKEGVPTMNDRIKAGKSIINDAKAGAEFKDYFSKEALDERAGENLKAAKEALEKADSKVSKTAALKLDVVNAWAGLQEKMEEHLGKVAHARADRATAALDKIKSPEIKDIASKIASIKEEHGGTLGEARASMKDMGKNAPENDSHKMASHNVGPGDR